MNARLLASAALVGLCVGACLVEPEIHCTGDDAITCAPGSICNEATGFCEPRGSNGSSTGSASGGSTQGSTSGSSSGSGGSTQGTTSGTSSTTGAGSSGGAGGTTGITNDAGFVFDVIVSLDGGAGGGGQLAFIGRGPDGRVVAADHLNNVLWAIDDVTGARELIAGKPGLNSAQDGPALDGGLFANPYGLAVLGSEILCTENVQPGAIRIFDGGFLGTYATFTFAVSGLAADPTTGVVYVAEALSHHVLAVYRDGGSEPVLPDSGSNAPYGLAVDSIRHRLYVAAGDTILMVPLPSGASTPFASAASATFSGIAVDPSGDVYAADLDDAVHRWLPDGSDAGQVVAPTIFHGPTGIIAEDGGAIVASQGVSGPSNLVRVHWPSGG